MTPSSCTARYNSREPPPRGRAGHLQSRTQSRTFPIDPRPSRRSTGGGKCAPRRPRPRTGSRNSPPRGAVYPTPPARQSSGDRVRALAAGTAPERSRLPDAASSAVVRRLNPTAFELRGPCSSY
uniref:Uncharacterized protein n=1 Tax=Amblyomma cajennense TaxID=34607 RepID=A0A023FEL8_AMBCJ